MGTNDILHQENHCCDEIPRYFKALEKECSRIFPSAILYFVLPYRGMPLVGNGAINDLERVLKTNCPKIRRLRPPDMYKLVDKWGIHPNKEGKLVLIEYFRRTFVRPKQKIFSRDSGRQKLGTPYSQAHLPVPLQYNPQHKAQLPQTHRDQQPDAEQYRNLQGFRVPSPAYPPAPAYHGLAREIAEAFVHMTQTSRFPRWPP